MQMTGDGLAAPDRWNKLPIFEIAQEFFVHVTIALDGTDLSCGVNNEVKKYLSRERRVEWRRKNFDWLRFDNVGFFEDWRAFFRCSLGFGAVNLSEDSALASVGDCRLNSAKILGRPHLP